MIRKIALVASLLVAAAAFGQEFGRASGGELDMFTKQPRAFSGSFGLTAGNNAFGSSRGYLASGGGTLVPDKMWFFASAERQSLPTNMANMNVNWQATSRQDLTAALSTTKFSTPALTMPSSFLSLHYTAVTSPSSFFTMSVSRSSTAVTP